MTIEELQKENESLRQQLEEAQGRLVNLRSEHFLKLQQAEADTKRLDHWAKIKGVDFEAFRKLTDEAMKK